MSFRFIEHTADIAVEITEDTIEKLFITSANAWLSSAVEILNRQLESSKKFIFTANTLEELLIEFLSELNFQLYTRKWIFISMKEIKLQQTGTGYQLEVEVFGQSFNENNHKLKVEIKAVTYHQMKIEKKNNNFFTKIVFDI